MSEPTKIQVRPRGPLIVEGEFQVLDESGAPFECPTPGRVALCRCGASKRKPLCDGAHNRIGFGAEPAPEE